MAGNNHSKKGNKEGCNTCALGFAFTRYAQPSKISTHKYTIFQAYCLFLAYMLAPASTPQSSSAAIPDYSHAVDLYILWQKQRSAVTVLCKTLVMSSISLMQAGTPQLCLLVHSYHWITAQQPVPFLVVEPLSVHKRL
jgi:hypothetical protein